MENEVVVKRFEAGVEAKVLKSLAKLFRDYNNCTEADIFEMKKPVSCVDPYHVCMVTAKTDEAKRVLARFVNKDNMPNYPTLADNGEGNSCYPIDYLTNIIAVINSMTTKYVSDPVRFKLGTDTPAIISNPHFEFLLAPRIEED